MIRMQRAFLSVMSLGVSLALTCCATVGTSRDAAVEARYSVAHLVTPQPGGAPWIRIDDLATNLRDATGSAAWQDADSSITPTGDGALRVVASPQMQRRVARVLDDFERMAAASR